MKLIESNNETVTLQVTREEFHVLRDVQPEAIEHLEANLLKYERLAKELQGATSGEISDALIDAGIDYDYSLEQLEAEIERGQKLLGQLYDLADVLEAITTEGDLARHL